jgi:O-antigen/teichoic acid export membrane protein
MDKRIVQRLLKGFGASLYGQAVVIVIQLAGVPILLNHWHASLYGEWLILFAIPSYLSLTDLGFSLSAANDMTSRVAREDRAGALTVFQSLGALVFLLAVVGLLAITAAAVLLPLGTWMHFSGLSSRGVRWVLWFLGAEVLIKLIEGINHAGFRASGDYALHVAINYSTLFAQHASIWVLATLGFGPVPAAAAFFVIRAITTPADAIILVRRHRWLRFGFGHARLDELHTLVRPALANMGIPLAQALNVQGMVLLVGSTLGPISVVTFSTLRTLTRLALQLVSTVSNSAEAELASAFGKGDQILLRTLYQHVVRGGLWLALTTSIALALSGSWILEFWTHGKVSMDSQLFHWLLASAVASALWYGSLTLLKAANRHLRAAAIYAASAGAALALSAVLLRANGQLASAGMSLLVMDAMMAAYTLRAAGRLCGNSAARNLYSALSPAPLLKLFAAKSHAS